MVGEPIDTAEIELELVVEGLTAPIDLADPDDGTGRLFVVEQQGIVSVLGADGRLSEKPLLDLRPHLLELKNDFEERGPLGFADWSAAFERPSGQLFLATPPSRWRDLWSFEKLTELDTRIIGVAEDAAGELYVLTNDEFGHGKNLQDPALREPEVEELTMVA